MFDSHIQEECQKTMLPLSRRTITSDLTFTLACVISVIIISVGIFGYRYQAQSELRKITADATVHTKLCSQVLKMPLWNLDFNAVDSITRSYLSLESIEAITIFNRDGSLLTQHKKNTLFNKDTLQFRDSIVYGNSLIGLIQMEFNTLSIVNIKRSIIIFIVILVIAISGVTIALNSVLLRMILGDALNKLSTGISFIAQGNYAHVISPVKQEDLNLIITGINSLSRTVSERESEIKKINEELEQRVEERTSQLKAAQSEIAEKAHKAGMADIATSVIHNVGNVLTSIITSCHELHSVLAHSRTIGLINAATLLNEQKNRLVEFMTADPRGKKLIDYLILLSGQIKDENGQLTNQVERISEKTKNIKEIIEAQQNYASFSSYKENMKLEPIIDDALEILNASLHKYSITLEKHFLPVPPIAIQKAKIMHIFINLIKNAIEAVQQSPIERRRITISIDSDEQSVYCRIIDSGYGIKADLLEKIFNHGFTTKKDGHGFGLHSCANYMTELNGKMWAESDGEGSGATFILRFPISKTNS
ncbi:MAG: GHKL domain-containing protein [Chitinivibrionales bacterium]|nr:GHKL domain-containing protein [Chitinivibrionales bacterium]